MPQVRSWEFRYAGTEVWYLRSMRECVKLLYRGFARDRSNFD